jgi:hypothetical protein
MSGERVNMPPELEAIYPELRPRWEALTAPCTCGHRLLVHYAGRGQCMESTPDRTWACDCAEYRRPS